MDVRSWNQSLIWSIGHIGRRGKNQFTFGFPRCNMNSKVQILGKRKVLTIKIRSETHFGIKHDSAQYRCPATLKCTLTSQLGDVNCGQLGDTTGWRQLRTTGWHNWVTSTADTQEIFNNYSSSPESIAHEAEGRMGYWLRGHEGERNNCLVKSN